MFSQNRHVRQLVRKQHRMADIVYVARSVNMISMLRILYILINYHDRSEIGTVHEAATKNHLRCSNGSSSLALVCECLTLILWQAGSIIGSVFNYTSEYCFVFSTD